MTREIKFRAYDLEYETHIDFDLEILSKEDVIHTYGKTKVIVQYTGLKDKNGKEIYEGDFLLDTEDSEPMRHRISWIEDEARFEIETLEDEDGNWSTGLIDDLKDFVSYGLKLKDFEIIGNIYQNPELLL